MDDLDAWVTVGDAAQTAIKLIFAAARRGTQNTSRQRTPLPAREPVGTGEEVPARN